MGPRVLVALLVVMAACGDKDDAPAAEPREPGAPRAPDAKPMAKPAATITLPEVKGAPIRQDVTLVAYSPGGWIVMELQTLDTPTFALPSTAPVAAAALALPADLPVVLLVDRSVTVAEIAPMIARLVDRCWGIGVASGTTLEALMPALCPVPPPSQEQVQLAVWLAPANVVLGQSRINEITEVTGFVPMNDALRDIKSSAFFVERTDAAFAAHDGARIADVTDVLAIVHGTGFTSTRWLPPARLPVALGDGVGIDPAPGVPSPPEPTPPLTPRLPDAISGGKVKFEGAAGDFSGGLTRQEVDRVVKSRKGTLQACYQREIQRDPKIGGGKLVVSFTIDAAGKVASARIAADKSTLHDANLEACIERQFNSMKFPAKGGAIVNYPLLYSAS